MEPENEQAYWAEVRAIALDVLQEAVEHDRPADEHLWETIDGHGWVIYTAKAQLVLAWSPNDGYSIENWGADGAVEDGQIQWSRLAFGALYADVSELLRALDGDAFSDEPEERAEALADAERSWGAA